MMSGRFATIVLDFTFNLFHCLVSRFTVTVLLNSDSVGVQTKFFLGKFDTTHRCKKMLIKKQYLNYVQDPEASSLPKSCKNRKILTILFFSWGLFWLALIWFRDTDLQFNI